MPYLEVWVDDPPLDEYDIGQLEEIIRDLDACLNVARPSVDDMRNLINSARHILGIELKVRSKKPIVAVARA